MTKKAEYTCEKCIISVGRSGSKWMESVCKELNIATKSNRVDIGVRVELPATVFAHLTDELYESKIVYRTEKYGDKVRTFCMNPKGAVVNENTNGIITVNSVKNLIEGMLIDFRSSVDGSIIATAGARRILSVDRLGKSITVSGTV